MQLRVTVSPDDVAFLDAYAAEHGLTSRSCALQHAIGALRIGSLRASYAEAWAEWSGDGDAEAWDVTTADKSTVRPPDA